MVPLACVRVTNGSVQVYKGLMDKRDEIIARLKEALRFYADPDSYFAILIVPDHPCGAFYADQDQSHSAEFTDRPLPGALARRVLQETGGQLLSERTCPVHSTKLCLETIEFCKQCEADARE